jgi:hypothetical protein
MSAQVCGKKYTTPLPFIPSPHPSPPPYPPPQRQMPRANYIGPLDPVTSSANGVDGVESLAHSIGNPFRSVPRPPPPPPAQCRQNQLFQWIKRSLTLGRVT